MSAKQLSTNFSIVKRSKGHSAVDKASYISRSVLVNEYGGQYKMDDNVILEVDVDENRGVRFRPTSAADTPEAMKKSYAQHGLEV